MSGFPLTCIDGNDEGPNDILNGLAGWQKKVKADMEVMKHDDVIAAIMATCKLTDQRKLSAESRVALRWNQYAWWALPAPLFSDDLKLVDGVYFRAWVCTLDGVLVDGHTYMGFDYCQICGELGK